MSNKNVMTEMLIKAYRNADVAAHVSSIVVQGNLLFDKDAIIIREINAKRYDSALIRKNMLGMKNHLGKVKQELKKILSKKPSTSPRRRSGSRMRFGKKPKYNPGTLANGYIDGGVQGSLIHLSDNVAIIKGLMVKVEKKIKDCDGLCFTELLREIILLENVVKITKNEVLKELEVRISVALG